MLIELNYKEETRFGPIGPSSKNHRNSGSRSFPRVLRKFESSQDEEQEQTKANDMSKNKAKTVEEFDRRFDEGESVFEIAEVTTVSRPNLETQRVKVDFPKYFLVKLDREAELRGISRQGLIKTWFYKRLHIAGAAEVGRIRESAMKNKRGNKKLTSCKSLE
jgi:hypothetical protein